MHSMRSVGATECITNYSLLFFQIPNHVAIKIALELKKLLIDNSLLDVYAIPINFFRHVGF